MTECESQKPVVMENIDKFDNKKQVVADKLQKREDERLADIQKRKEEKSLVTSAQENTKFFHDHFTSEKIDLESELQACDSLDKNKLVEKFDDLSVRHQKLQRFLTESTMFLPSYDVRQSQDILAKLQSQIQEKRDELLPKKKFTFRSKKKGTVSEKQEEVKKETIPEDESVILADCKFTDKKGLDLKMEEEINKKDVALARLESCTVKLCGAASAIHINKLTNCTILSGPVSGSIFIRECKNCTFVVPCQQLRIHTTTDTKFYIHVTSRAIIEDSSAVSFGPYNWTYPNIEKHYEISGLDKSRNNWDDIDDFNWLAADKHSPNWSLIPESERSSNWN
ncbi:tubulin-specific chaperone C-like [Mercenaria mercenaria]|uniref:tubulin-specific chaperone C-like n=1 Tax=Mercenaria mercenaria TaxID=6596 RepID=UPI001E1DE195|nr:tubulin-specific chaperone C-like [Mercenaria mercenaria]